ncbi:hypothetical protein Nepgr_018684 [Nepenthes gracilis]|uniref:Uncharacterized protein n=1 Tax=Nepenthes gracilis TaxID=150966 RepID=A0AAD3XTM7_NEPGR|nr:hypothetical protein Nepgr_018684 [Nepenthes gracilis]
MASVADIASVLRENDVKALCVEFNVPKEIAWRVPGRNDKAFAPPARHIKVYEAYLRSGLRLPLPDDLQSLLKALRVPIAQLHANTIRYLCTLYIFLRKRGKKLRMSIVKVLFKINQGGEWISLVPHPDLKINKAIYDLLKNWKNRFFFMSVGATWPLPKDWGQVPEAYTGTPSMAETAAQEWLTKLIEENPDKFKRDFLVSRAETKKLNWGPPSPVQKPTLPVRMMRPEDSKGMIIRMRHTDEGFIGPLSEKVLETPSSSSSRIDYVAAGICYGPSSTAGLEATWPVESGEGVILAQPTPQAAPCAVLTESLTEPRHEPMVEAL